MNPTILFAGGIITFILPIIFDDSNASIAASLLIWMGLASSYEKRKEEREKKNL